MAAGHSAPFICSTVSPLPTTAHALTLPILFPIPPTRQGRKEQETKRWHGASLLAEVTLQHRHAATCPGSPPPLLPRHAHHSRALALMMGAPTYAPDAPRQLGAPLPAPPGSLKPHRIPEGFSSHRSPPPLLAWANVQASCSTTPSPQDNASTSCHDSPSHLIQALLSS